MKACHVPARVTEPGGEFDDRHAVEVQSDDDLPLQGRKRRENSLDGQPIQQCIDTAARTARLGCCEQLERGDISTRPIRANFRSLCRGNAKVLRDLALGRLAPQQRPQLAFRSAPTPLERARAARRPHDTLAVPGVVHQLAHDKQPRIRLERRALRRIVAIRRFEESYGTDLLEIAAIEAVSHEAARRATAQIQMLRNETLAFNTPSQRRCTELKSHTQTSSQKSHVCRLRRHPC
jgi:hypothetical protein